jgi:hypothetical protein
MRLDHRRFVGALHHRIIDGAPPRRREGAAVEPEKTEIAFRFGDAVAHRRHGVGIEALILLDQRVGSEHAITGIP